MAFGKLVEELNLVSLPENWTYTVTKWENHEKENWYTAFEYKKKPPYVVNPKPGQKERVVTSYLSSTSLWDSGNGLSHTLYFSVSGQINGKSKERKGYVKFGSTDWSKHARPDYSILTFGFEGEPAETINQEVPFLVSPNGYYLAFAIKEEQITMIVSRENNLTNDLISLILQGIVELHSAAIKKTIAKI